MSFWSTFTDIVTTPIRMICNWAEEPLRRFEHHRQEETRDRDVHREIEKQVGVDRVLSEQRIREKQLEAQLELDRKRFLSEQKTLFFYF